MRQILFIDINFFDYYLTSTLSRRLVHSFALTIMALIDFFCFEKATVQLASNFTLKCEHLREPCRIFKSAHELLVSAYTHLDDCLRVLASYLRVHDYCTNAKYSRTFVHVARTQAFASLVVNSATCVTKQLRAYAYMNEFVFIIIIPLLGCL